MKSRKTARYEAAADRLSHEAEDSASVSVYISPDDVARALDDDAWDPDQDPIVELRTWVKGRRLLGFEPSADDILEWLEVAS